MKILFATPECTPWVKTGGLGDVSGALPPALAALGHDVRVLMPAYRGLKVSGEVGDVVDLPAWGPWPAAQLLPVRLDSGVTLLLLAAPSLYQRPGGPYVDSTGHDYDDNVLRFGFLSRVAAMLGTGPSPTDGWQADVVHANDWPCALAPLYLASARGLTPAPTVAASVMTIHNLAFQGVFPMHHADVLGIPHHWRGMEGVEFWGQLSMLKAGLQFADAITTVSPTYAREIQTPEFGVGLDGVLRARADRLSGILNGIDTRVWNPAADPLLLHPFGPGDLAGKARNKAALQAQLGLAQDPAALLFGVVSRLTEQKGIDLVLQNLEAVLAGGAQLVVLGQGDPGLQQALGEAAARAPRQVHVTVGFNEALAHRIEAGSDCFLMPSRFEPCGLNQMYSQAYGTPPLVNATGGLVDSVIDADADPRGGTGFVMRTADAAGFADAVGRVRAAFGRPAVWKRLQANGMRRSFGWEASAGRYLEVYAAALEAAGRSA
ncbi:MAG TPA: glycogen synthase GlgA [Ramlibacter sp.]|jgi:starch synthase|uniref:glycogen synthase GlgA n=1 Tax=Ramlibacter sp. TaxID=1917967 RepID=UPI002D292711|nr:glycogen synthase GlgA [Ramlibacter sp.]HZY18349.1 glycogen synthase GlgA [Ramlibacter sp.]